jgi:2-dehydro-3-deoxy-D-arabinonate dehydratase
LSGRSARLIRRRIVRLVRFRGGDVLPRVGVLDGDAVTGFAAAGLSGDLLALPLDRVREICTSPGGATIAAANAQLLAPVDGRMEVWAAGVT